MLNFAHFLSHAVTNIPQEDWAELTLYLRDNTDHPIDALALLVKAVGVIGAQCLQNDGDLDDLLSVVRKTVEFFETQPKFGQTIIERQVQ
jgi:hypothetical protein